MPFDSWNTVHELLARATRPASIEQKALGRYASTEIAGDVPISVAAVRLRHALADVLDLPPPRPLTERYSALLRILHRPSDPQITPANDDEAEAWVRHLRLLRRREDLCRLRIQKGDIVKTNTDKFAEISSIGDDGRLYFKGGGGFVAWPDQVEVVAWQNDQSPAANDARRNAANTASSRRSTLSQWSAAKQHDLLEFEVTTEIVEQASSHSARRRPTSVLPAAQTARVRIRA